MNKLSALFSVLFIAFLLCGCTETIQNQPKQITEETVSFTIKYFDKDNAIILDKTIEIEKGTNAFEAMKENVTVEYEMYSLDAFVKSIAGITPPENYYLGLYVNGEYANKSISGYMIDANTIIEWKTEKIEDFGMQ